MAHLSSPSGLAPGSPSGALTEAGQPLITLAHGISPPALRAGALCLKELRHETHLSAEQAGPQAPARLPVPDGNCRRPQGHRQPSPVGPQAPVGLARIGRGAPRASAESSRLPARPGRAPLSPCPASCSRSPPPRPSRPSGHPGRLHRQPQGRQCRCPQPGPPPPARDRPAWSSRQAARADLDYVLVGRQGALGRDFARHAAGTAVEALQAAQGARRACSDAMTPDLHGSLRRHRVNRQFPGRMMSLVLRGAIRLYQLTLAYFFVGACRYEPSCSAYAVEAVTRMARCGAAGSPPIACAAAAPGAPAATTPFRQPLLARARRFPATPPSAPDASRKIAD